MQDNKPFTPPSSITDFNNFHQAPRLTTQAERHLLRPNAHLSRALTSSAAHGLPPISINPLSGQHLTILARLMGARDILEVGTLGGYSTICLAQADPSVRVTTIELDSHTRDVALDNVARLPNQVEILLGEALEVMGRLAEQGRQFDMVFIDADLGGKAEQFDLAVRLTRVGGAVLLDDAVVSMFAEGQGAAEEEQSLLAAVGGDERVLATLVPTVQCHELLPTPVLNGFILAVVNHH